MRGDLVCIALTIAVVICLLGHIQSSQTEEITTVVNSYETSEGCMFVSIGEFDKFFSDNADRIVTIASRNTGVYGITIGYYVVLQKEE